MAKALRWLVCFLPPVATITFLENPALGGLNAINAAGLLVLSPFVVVAGFAVTAVITLLSRWLGHRLNLRSRTAFASLMMVMVGLFSPWAYLDGDWLFLGMIELTSLPAALLLAHPPAPSTIGSAADGSPPAASRGR